MDKSQLASSYPRACTYDYTNKVLSYQYYYYLLYKIKYIITYMLIAFINDLIFIPTLYWVIKHYVLSQILIYIDYIKIYKLFNLNKIFNSSFFCKESVEPL